MNLRQKWMLGLCTAGVISLGVAALAETGNKPAERRIAVATSRPAGGIPIRVVLKPRDEAVPRSMPPTSLYAPYLHHLARKQQDAPAPLVPATELAKRFQPPIQRPEAREHVAIPIPTDWDQICMPIPTEWTVRVVPAAASTEARPPVATQPE